MSHRGAASLAALMALFAFGPARADGSRAPFWCPAPPGFVRVEGIHDIPLAILAKDWDIALLGEDYDLSDDYQGRWHAGMTFVIHRDRLWIVGLMVGGIAMHPAVQGFVVTPDGKAATELTPPARADGAFGCVTVEDFAQLPAGGEERR